MAKMSLGAKATRVLTLLMGMRNSRIASAMAAYGFGDADLNEGWALLHAVGKVRLDTNAVGGGGDKATIDKLDAWENRWFPIVSATLERRSPAIHERVFMNLSQTEGPAVTVSVRTLLERLDQMAAGAYGPEGAAAKSQLELRGLTAAVMNEARALLETVGKIAVNPSAPATDAQVLAKAESDLWAWYLEWSQIARVAVTQRALLRQLGFVASRSRRSEDEEEDDETPVVVPDGTGVTPLSSTT